MKTLQLLLNSEKAQFFCLIVITIIFSTVSAPTYSAERKSYTVIGRPDCQRWTKDRQERASGDEPLTLISDLGDTSWLFGYLSSLNETKGGKIDVLAAIDSDTINIWVDRYCIQNPNKDITDAALDLFVELMKIQLKINPR